MNCTVNVMSLDQGILTLEVPIPDDIAADDDRRPYYCDGVADGIAALANAVWPNAQ